jgi:tRNA pseudouridine13 synthase
LEAERHGNKLRTGHLAGNRFELLVREVPEAALAAAPGAAARFAREGFANRFGAQRFGREGDNAERGLALLRGESAGRDRRAARFLVSALQAQVFNAVLAERPLEIGRLEEGDVAVLHGSGGLFRVDEPALEQARADAFEISPTGPIFGTRVSLEPAGVPAERERAVLRRLGIPAELRPPRGLRLRGGRRTLRVRPQGVEVQAEARGLRLRFTLPPGCYATVFVDALLEAVEAGSDRTVVS